MILGGRGWKAAEFSFKKKKRERERKQNLKKKKKNPRLSMTLGRGALIRVSAAAPRKSSPDGDRSTAQSSGRAARSQPTSEPGLGMLGVGERPDRTDSTIIGSETIGHPYGKDKVDPYLTAGLQISSRCTKDLQETSKTTIGLWDENSEGQL